jgi:hypothetical protein
MRRMFRRHIRKTLAQEVPPILQEANFAFDKGEYGRAGELFEKIAQTAFARGRPRAPLFYLQAGRARARAGQIALALPSLKHGLELLAQRGLWERFQQLGQQVVTELTEQSFPAEAKEIQAFLNHSSRPGVPVMPSQPANKPPLPTHCPACGAAVRPDEIEWLDQVTAECAYCGSPLR